MTELLGNVTFGDTPYVIGSGAGSTTNPRWPYLVGRDSANTTSGWYVYPSGSYSANGSTIGLATAATTGIKGTNSAGKTTFTWTLQMQYPVDNAEDGASAVTFDTYVTDPYSSTQGTTVQWLISVTSPWGTIEFTTDVGSV